MMDVNRAFQEHARQCRKEARERFFVGAAFGFCAGFLVAGYLFLVE